MKHNSLYYTVIENFNKDSKNFNEDRDLLSLKNNNKFLSELNAIKLTLSKELQTSLNGIKTVEVPIDISYVNTEYPTIKLWLHLLSNNYEDTKSKLFISGTIEFEISSITYSTPSWDIHIKLNGTEYGKTMNKQVRSFTEKIRKLIIKHSK